VCARYSSVSIAICQWIPNYHGFLKHRVLGPAPEVSDSVVFSFSLSLSLPPLFPSLLSKAYPSSHILFKSFPLPNTFLDSVIFFSELFYLKVFELRIGLDLNPGSTYKFSDFKWIILSLCASTFLLWKMGITVSHSTYFIELLGWFNEYIYSEQYKKCYIYGYMHIYLTLIYIYIYSFFKQCKKLYFTSHLVVINSSLFFMKIIIVILFFNVFIRIN
jgi:hypothetical protein